MAGNRGDRGIHVVEVERGKNCRVLGDDHVGSARLGLHDASAHQPQHPAQGGDDARRPIESCQLGHADGLVRLAGQRVAAAHGN